MVRFVLPTDFSAIAFEYQRGSDSDEDIRLAVIRRRSDDHDVPVYRLYKCGFRKELFVDEEPWRQFTRPERLKAVGAAQSIIGTA